MRAVAPSGNARHIATDALVGKAKDQLAIEGKDSQLADLRAQIERNVAAAAALSDARLNAEIQKVLAEPEVSYDALVQVMDAVRAGHQAQGARIVATDYFPNISIGDAPIVKQ